MSTAPEIHKGLAGVVVDRTEISNVVPETNSLTYRGYPVQELAASRTFEEVAHLIWHGELPTAAELAELTAAERSQRELSRSTIAQIERLPGNCHPMDVLRSAVSAFGAEDPTEDAAGREAVLAKSLAMMARLPDGGRPRLPPPPRPAADPRPTRRWASRRTSSTCASARCRSPRSSAHSTCR